jgi:hypothetical protein
MFPLAGTTGSAFLEFPSVITYRVVLDSPRSGVPTQQSLSPRDGLGLSRPVKDRHLARMRICAFISGFDSEGELLIGIAGQTHLPF